MTEGILFKKPRDARLLKKRGSRFILLDGQLYRKSFSYPLLKYMRPTEVDYVFREIHEGINGNHLGVDPWPTRSLDKDTIGSPCDRTLQS